MYGAIIGDICGSSYAFNPYKTDQADTIKVPASDSRLTDSTALTCAFDSRLTDSTVLTCASDSQLTDGTVLTSASDSQFTDDTVLTCAVIDVILHKTPYIRAL
ncbi:hypothetical protein PilKf_00679 [Pillotina sp. SPG140]